MFDINLIEERVRRSICMIIDDATLNVLYNHLLINCTKHNTYLDICIYPTEFYNMPDWDLNSEIISQSSSWTPNSQKANVNADPSSYVTVAQYKYCPSLKVKQGESKWQKFPRRRIHTEFTMSKSQLFRNHCIKHMYLASLSET